MTISNELEEIIKARIDELIKFVDANQGVFSCQLIDRLYSTNVDLRKRYQNQLARDKDALVERGLLLVKQVGRNKQYFTTEYAAANNITADIAKQPTKKTERGDQHKAEKAVKSEMLKLNMIWKPTMTDCTEG